MGSQVHIPVAKPDQFLSDVVAWTLTTDNALQKEAGWHILATFVNKRTEGVFSLDIISYFVIADISCIHLRCVFIPVRHI
jgi:hypothetical protein